MTTITHCSSRQFSGSACLLTLEHLRGDAAELRVVVRDLEPEKSIENAGGKTQQPRRAAAEKEGGGGYINERNKQWSAQAPTSFML